MCAVSVSGALATCTRLRLNTDMAASAGGLAATRVGRNVAA